MIDQEPESAAVELLPEDADTLRMLAAASGARNIVEVHSGEGSASAESTLALGEALRQNRGTLTSIVAGDEQAEAVRGQVRDAGLGEVSEVLSGDPMERLASLRGAVDLLFLAGNFDYAEAVRAAMPRLRPGSLVVVHRGGDEEGYLRAVSLNPSFETTLLEPGSDLSVSLLKG